MSFMCMRYGFFPPTFIAGAGIPSIPIHVFIILAYVRITNMSHGDTTE